MDFRFTEDQLTLAESVRDYLWERTGRKCCGVWMQMGNARSCDLAGLVDMGLTGLLVPEAQGGLGMGLVEAALIAAECGRACLAEPLVDTAFVGVPWLLAKGETGQLAAIAWRVRSSCPCRTRSTRGWPMGKANRW
jgi:alkylation response protein AidB-like acyl-CoA dehydrogenase